MGCQTSLYWFILYFPGTVFCTRPHEAMFSFPEIEDNELGHESHRREPSVYSRNARAMLTLQCSIWKFTNNFVSTNCIPSVYTLCSTVLTSAHPVQCLVAIGFLSGTSSWHFAGLTDAIRCHFLEHSLPLNKLISELY